MTSSVEQTGRQRIYFDDGKSYMMAILPPPKTKFRIWDRLNRSPEEVKFLDAFIRIFFAAAEGDLETCQTIVEKEKFLDIDAYSMGQFHDKKTRKRLDRMTPLHVAQHYGHNEIVDYFSKKFNKNPSAERKQTFYEQHYKKSVGIFFSLNEPRSETLMRLMRTVLMGTYFSDIRAEAKTALDKLDYDGLEELIRFRCEKLPQGTGYSEIRLKLFALRDVLAEQRSSAKGCDKGITHPQTVNE
jgi:hypothetical protein